MPKVVGLQHWRDESWTTNLMHLLASRLTNEVLEVLEQAGTVRLFFFFAASTS